MADRISDLHPPAVTPRKPYPSEPPTRSELLDAVRTTNLELSRVFGRWESLPDPLRAELRSIAAPLLNLLLRTRSAGR
jgi:hypothetical protein